MLFDRDLAFWSQMLVHNRGQFPVDQPADFAVNVIGNYSFV